MKFENAVKNAGVAKAKTKVASKSKKAEKLKKAPGSFVDAIENQGARTTNGMKARKSTANACVDLFYKIGASRGQDIIPGFSRAMGENEDYALRIAAWVRDVRGGAGERKIFRDILVYLEKTDTIAAKALAAKAPELGRWDDILVFTTPEMKNFAYGMIKEALLADNGLCAKWMPRKGQIANEIRTFMGLSPRQYRKGIVALTNVVETQMCQKDWDNINFSHVPSVASARYKKAFGRNTPKYAQYVQALVRGDEGVKVNASAIFPHDVLKGRINCYGSINWSKTDLDLIEKQWEALPNYIGGANVLPLVDVSGSMTCPVGGNKNLSCLEVAVSLGLYLADKNVGKFNGAFLTFSGSPELLYLKGAINKKIDQMVRSNWGMNTNLHAAFSKILDTAVKGKVPASEMPETLIIFSDMQFDRCISFDDSAIKMIERKYKAAGYALPKVVFWNLNSYDNAPVKFNQNGVALVSGFSPSILKGILAGDMECFSPEAIMLNTIMDDRYKVL